MKSLIVHLFSILRFTAFCILIFNGAGCKCVSKSGSDGSAGSFPSFSEEEVRSKTWQNDRGQTMKSLDWRIVDLKLRGQLLIVQYGEAQTKIPMDIEFYRVVKTPNAYAREYNTIKEEFSSTNVFVPGNSKFILVGRDSDYSNVKTVEVLNPESSPSIAITRETMPGQMDGRQRAFYLLAYKENFTMSRDIHTWVSNVSNKE